MKCQKIKKIYILVMFTLSIILSWGGILYAVDDPKCFRIIGVIVSFIGYGIFFGAISIYEKTGN